MKTPDKFISEYYGEDYLKDGMYLEKDDILLMTSEYAKDVLMDFVDFLLKEGYCDSDVVSEGNTAIDKFMHPELNK